MIAFGSNRFVLLVKSAVMKKSLTKSLPILRFLKKIVFNGSTGARLNRGDRSAQQKRPLRLRSASL
jgi:hypothetical protein